MNDIYIDTGHGSVEGEPMQNTDEYMLTVDNGDPSPYDGACASTWLTKEQARELAKHLLEFADS